MRLHGTLAAGNQQGIHRASQRTIITMREERQPGLASDRALSCRTQQCDPVDRGKLSPLSQAIDRGKDFDRTHNIQLFNGWGR
jgi:hypothetical protein